MNKYVLTHYNGLIQITTLIMGTIEEAIEKMNHGVHSENPVVEFHAIDASETISSPRQYRNAWRFDKEAKQITVDINHAKDIHLANCKKERDEKLEMLNNAYDLAFSEGDDETLQEISAMRVSLKEIDQDPTLQDINCIGELSAFKPDALKIDIDAIDFKEKIRMNKEKQRIELEKLKKDLETQTADFNQSMASIKGFLMMIPDIQNSLSEMQSNLNKGKQDEN